MTLNRCGEGGIAKAPSIPGIFRGPPSSLALHGPCPGSVNRNAPPPVAPVHPVLLRRQRNDNSEPAEPNPTFPRRNSCARRHASCSLPLSQDYRDYVSTLRFFFSPFGPALEIRATKLIFGGTATMTHSLFRVEFAPFGEGLAGRRERRKWPRKRPEEFPARDTAPRPKPWPGGRSGGLPTPPRARCQPNISSESVHEPRLQNRSRRMSQ